VQRRQEHAVVLRVALEPVVVEAENAGVEIAAELGRALAEGDVAREPPAPRLDGVVREREVLSGHAADVFLHERVGVVHRRGVEARDRLGKILLAAEILLHVVGALGAEILLHAALHEVQLLLQLVERRVSAEHGLDLADHGVDLMEQIHVDGKDKQKRQAEHRHELGPDAPEPGTLRPAVTAHF